MNGKLEICPVCTLYLRPGITLKSHLASHPKQKIIEALVNSANVQNDLGCITPTESEIDCQSQVINRSVWNQPNTSIQGIQLPTANHSFIYQQFMSTSQSPLGQQYITIPTVFNPSPMMCPPYVFQQQQQQVIMSSALSNIVRCKTPDNDQLSAQDVCDEQHKDMCGIENNLSSGGCLTSMCDGDTAPNTYLEDDDYDKNENSPLCDYLRIRQDLNKACQTHQEFDEIEGDSVYELAKDDSELIGSDNMNINDMQVVICDNLITTDAAPLPDNLQVNSINYGHPTDLAVEYFQDNISQQSDTNLSIRADEHMPPRGELSGLESNGATNDTVWNNVHYDNSISHDLYARETWEASDGSDCEYSSETQNHVLPLRSDELDDTPTIISVTEPPLNFKCPTCGKGFACHKERKAHQNVEHIKTTNIEKSNKSGLYLIGCNVPNKSLAKKLTIKPKRTLEIKSESNFDELFNHQMQNGTAGKDENKCNINENKGVDALDCSLGSLTFSDVKSLMKHKQDARLVSYNRYRCDTCGEELKSHLLYLKHLKIHPLECKLCGRYFYSRQNIQLHMKRHLGIKPFVCEFCKKGFSSKQKLFEHRNIHTGEMPIKCKMCNETFRRHSNLVQHRNVHHFNIQRKVKDYFCHCGEVVHSKKKLAWHKEIHDAKPKACTKCNEKFIHMASLTRHIRKTHNDRLELRDAKSTEDVECPICKNVYLKSSLKAHIKRHEGAKAFKCLTCNKDFTTKWNLQLHQWTHAGRTAKPFRCEYCKAAFIRETEYTAHVNAHKSVRPYTCNHCGAQFIRKNNCQRHVKEHERDKTFTCQICGKAFHRSYYLKDHLRVHSGARPYVCHICGKTSSTKSNHNKHTMIHHAKEPVSTEN